MLPDNTIQGSHATWVLGIQCFAGLSGFKGFGASVDMNRCRIKPEYVAQLLSSNVRRSEAKHRNVRLARPCS
jgi:hypothetical protein